MQDQDAVPDQSRRLGPMEIFSQVLDVEEVVLNVSPGDEGTLTREIRPASFGCSLKAKILEISFALVLSFATVGIGAIVIFVFFFVVPAQCICLFLKWSLQTII